MDWDGPHVYASLQVPPGWFVLSLYDFNKDGHMGYNRWRDYRLSVRQRPPGLPLESIQGFEQWPEAAAERLIDFRGGVWKRFLVRGPRALAIQVNRNFSRNTVVAGLFLDRLDERPSPYFDKPKPQGSSAVPGATPTGVAVEARDQEALLQRFFHERSDPAQAALRAQRFAPGRTSDQAAQKLFAALREACGLNPFWHETQGRRFYLALLGWFSQKLPDAFAPEGSAGAPARPMDEAERQLRDHLATCFYELRLYSEWERQLRQIGLRPARDIEAALRSDGKSSYVGRGHQTVVDYLRHAAAPASPLSSGAPAGQGTGTQAGDPTVAASTP